MAATTSDSLCYALILSSCFLVSSVVDSRNITVHRGQSVILPCRVQVSENTAVKAIEWTRPDLKEEYVLLYRDGQLDTDHQYSPFKNRVVLKEEQMKEGDLSLNLKNVRINDTGTYECRFSQGGRNRRKRATIDTEPINTINLTVVEPDSRNITVHRGQSVILPCRVQVSENTAVKAIEWTRPDLKEEYVLLYRDEQLDPVNQYPPFKNRVELKEEQMKDGDLSLNLKNVRINDTGTYECHVSQGGRATIDTEPISIINLRVVEPDSRNITVHRGQSVILPCRVQVSENTAVKAIEWTRPDLKEEYVLLYRNGQLDPVNQYPPFKNRVELKDEQMKDGDLSLNLTNVRINDTGTYECHVSQGGRKRSKRATIDTEPISIINLRVVEPGTDKEDGGNTTVIVVVVPVVLVLLLVVGIVGFLFYKKQRGSTDQSSYQQPPEQRTELQTVQTDSAAESSSPAPFKQQ